MSDNLSEPEETGHKAVRFATDVSDQVELNDQTKNEFIYVGDGIQNANLDPSVQIEDSRDLGMNTDGEYNSHHHSYFSDQTNENDGFDDEDEDEDEDDVVGDINNNKLGVHGQFRYKMNGSSNISRRRAAVNDLSTTATATTVATNTNTNTMTTTDIPMPNTHSRFPNNCH